MLSLLLIYLKWIFRKKYHLCGQIVCHFCSLVFLSRLDHFPFNFLLCNHPCLFIDESVSTMHGQAPAVERESCDEQARFSWGSESLMQPALLYSLLLLLCTETGGAMANHSMFCLHALHICRHFLQSRPGFFFKLYFVVQIACNCCIHSCTLWLGHSAS